MDITILGIESSCDDTSAAVIQNGVLLSNVIANQSVHEMYGGVVPELASRAHQKNIIPVVSEALRRSGIDKSQLSAVAFTRGPGLMGSLLVGTSFAKSFAQALGIPIIDVNHLQAHILAHFIKEPDVEPKHPKFPFICLLVSGGNSQIVLVKSYNEMEIIGQTIDDAAGEAFDKCSKVMGLPTRVVRLSISWQSKAILWRFRSVSRTSPVMITVLAVLKRHFSIFYAISKPKIRILLSKTRLICVHRCKKPLSIF